jgi:hypothetical protein
LKASVDVVRLLAFQAVAFRGRDESVGSTNRENFLEILGLTISYNEKLAEVTAKAPKNATYTSPTVQKQILHMGKLHFTPLKYPPIFTFASKV